MILLIVNWRGVRKARVFRYLYNGMIRNMKNKEKRFLQKPIVLC